MYAMRIKDVAFLILAQAATKGFTLILNQLLLRRITPEVFGVAAYFEFITNTALFFSREAERISIQRIQGADARNTQQSIVNFAYLPIFISWPILSFLYYIQKSSQLYSDTITKLPNFGSILFILFVLIQVELLAEPFYSISQFEMNMKIKSKTESLAVFVKCVTTFSSLLIFHHEGFFLVSPVMAFALGRLAYALTVYLLYWRSYSQGYPRMRSLVDGTLLDRSVLPIYLSLCVQMIFKHLLAEGDTLLVSYLFSLSEQGVYSVISNFGSLLTRLLFLPIEETLRASMTKIFSSKNPNYQDCYGFMETLTVFYTSLCVLVVLGGYTNGSYMLECILGNSPDWRDSDVFDKFPYYILYIPFMAFNGIFEAFFSSASTHKQINRFSVFMSALSIVVFGLLYYLIAKLGMQIPGLILSNIVNMCHRIVYCLFFMRLLFKSKVDFRNGKQLRRLSMPIVLGLSAFQVQRALFGHTMSQNFHELLISAGLCGLCLLGNLVNELPLIRQVLSKRKKE